MGTAHEDPAVPSRQDWRGPAAGWTPGSTGHGLVEFPAPVTLQGTLRFEAPGTRGRLIDGCGQTHVEAEIAPEATPVTLKNVAQGIGKAELAVPIAAAKPYGPDYVEIQRATP